jgi:hypothetical protein
LRRKWPNWGDITLNFASQQIENPLMESKEEQELAVGIDEELNEVRKPYKMKGLSRLQLRCYRMLETFVFVVESQLNELNELLIFNFQLAECISQMRNCHSGIRLAKFSY